MIDTDDQTGSVGRFVMLVAVVANEHYRNESPEEAVKTVLASIANGLEVEVYRARGRAGSDPLAHRQLDQLRAEVLALLQIVEAVAVDEAAELRLPRVNPEPAKAALYAWAGSIVGGIGGALIGMLLGAAAAAAGAIAALPVLGVLGSWAGSVAGARYGAGMSSSEREELRKVKNYATIGAALFPWFGVGAAAGAALGASSREGNPRWTDEQVAAAVNAILKTPWPPRLQERWAESGWTAGEMAEAVVETVQKAGWDEEDVVRDPRHAMVEATTIWDSQPTESGWGEADDYVESVDNPAVTVKTMAADGGAGLTVEAGFHCSLRRASLRFGPPRDRTRSPQSAEGVVDHAHRYRRQARGHEVEGVGDEDRQGDREARRKQGGHIEHRGAQAGVSPAPGPVHPSRCASGSRAGRRARRVRSLQQVARDRRGARRVSRDEKESE